MRDFCAANRREVAYLIAVRADGNTAIGQKVAPDQRKRIRVALRSVGAITAGALSGLLQLVRLRRSLAPGKFYYLFRCKPCCSIVRGLFESHGFAYLLQGVRNIAAGLSVESLPEEKWADRHEQSP